MSDTGTPDVDGGQQEAPAVTDWQAEAKRWQAEAEKELRLKRKAEDRNKSDLARIEKLEASSLSDTEKAVREALERGRTEGRQETLQQVGHRLVDAEVKAAAQGRGVNVDALLAGLDRGRFLGDDLEPDAAAIGQWVDALAPKRDAAGFDIGQGARGNGNDLTGQDEFTRNLIAKVHGLRT